MQRSSNWVVKKDGIMKKDLGFSLLELMMVVVMIGVLALIAAPQLLNAAENAKEGAIKANVSSAASTAMTHLTIENKDAYDAAFDATEQLNDANSANNTNDDPKSPYNQNEAAYVADQSTDIGGQVTIYGEEEEYEIIISGWNKTADRAIMTKHIVAFDDFNEE